MEQNGQSLTVAGDPSMLVFCYGEKRWPAGKILQVEADIVVLRKRIKVCEIHIQEVLRAEGS